MAWSPPACWEKKATRFSLLERNDRVGGCLRTEEITAPGFLHDVMATTLVLFLTSPAYGAIGKDLEARGFACRQHRPADRRASSRRLACVCSRATARATSRPSRRCAPGDGAAFAREMDRDGRRRAVPVRAARRPAVVARDGEIDRARGVAARPARARRLVRRGAAAGARTISRRPMRPRRCTRCGRPGGCIAGSIRRAPIPPR